jgi:hypothetical protein
MANYYATMRSNYFAVHDAQSFIDWCVGLGLEHITRNTDESETLHGFLGDENGVPSFRFDDGGGDHEIDFYAELSKHLQDGWVAVVMEVGAEKLRYLVGYAVAVNSSGKCCNVSIERIYQLAKRLGEHITEATY